MGFGFKRFQVPGGGAVSLHIRIKFLVRVDAAEFGNDAAGFELRLGQLLSAFI